MIIDDNQLSSENNILNITKFGINKKTNPSQQLTKTTIDEILLPFQCWVLLGRSNTIFLKPSM